MSVAVIGIVSENRGRETDLVVVTFLFVVEEFLMDAQSMFGHVRLNCARDYYEDLQCL